MKRNLKNLLNTVAENFLSEWIYDLAGTFLGRDGKNRGDCLKMAKSFQVIIFDELLNEFAGKIQIIKNLNHEHHYILDIFHKEKHYRITSYIIGALAISSSSRRKVSTKESKYFEYLHYASLTKLQIKNGESFSDVGSFFNEPGFGLSSTLEEGKNIELRAKVICLEKIDKARIADYFSNHPELDWLGRQENECIKIDNCILTNIGVADFLFIDHPASVEQMRKFEHEVSKCRVINTFASVKFNSNGDIDALIQVAIDENDKEVKITFLYTLGKKTKIIILTPEELYDTIYTNRLNKENDNIWPILKVGFALGLVERESRTMKSEWIKRLTLLCDRSTYTEHLKQQKEFRLTIS